MSKASTVEHRERPLELAEAYGAYPQLWAQRPHWPEALSDDLNLNCSHCRMTKVAESRQASLSVWPRRDWGPFLNSVKCCAHQPHWPNFLIGAAIESSAGEAAILIENLLIRSQLFVWGARPSRERRLAEARSGQCGYGRAAALACPLLSSSGQCSVWQFRPGTCVTYVCQSARGAQGLSAWREYELKLVAWESELAHQLAWQLGYTNDDLAMKLTFTEARDFYLKCHGLLSSGWRPEFEVV